MKVEQKKVFQPMTITIESEAELLVLLLSLNTSNRSKASDGTSILDCDDRMALEKVNQLPCARVYHEVAKNVDCMSLVKNVFLGVK